MEPKTELVAYRHHILYDKLVPGKSFASRALLERDMVKKHIEREHGRYRQLLALHIK